MKKIPEIIQKVGFDFNWSEEKVWKLNVLAVEMNIEELEWHLSLPFWSTKNGYYDLTPNEVLNNAEEHKEEFERILKADLNYPLDIMFWKGNWLLLDGLHRLVKAKHLGHKKVTVRKIDKKYIPQIIK